IAVLREESSITGEYARGQIIRSRVARARSRRSPNLPDSVTKLPPQQRSQRDAVGIADTRGDFVDAFLARLQEMDGPLDAQALNVRQRRHSEHRLHSARECSLARRDRFRRVVERE